MRIELELLATDPPVGALLQPGGGRVVFEGWLGLMRVLADELSRPGPGAPPPPP